MLVPLSLPAGTKNLDKFTYDPSTGGCHVWNWASNKRANCSEEQVWAMLHAAEQAKELLVCSVGDANRDGVRSGFSYGLVEAHAYSIKEVSEAEAPVAYSEQSE